MARTHVMRLSGDQRSGFCSSQLSKSHKDHRRRNIDWLWYFVSHIHPPASRLEASQPGPGVSFFEKEGERIDSLYMMVVNPRTRVSSTSKKSCAIMPMSSRSILQRPASANGAEEMWVDPSSEPVFAQILEGTLREFQLRNQGVS